MGLTSNGRIDRPNTGAPALVVDEGAGFVRVRDPRIFHAGNRAFCRRWAEVASHGSGVIKARFDFASATCRLDFRPGELGRDEMARFFADTIHQAIGSLPAPTRKQEIAPSRQAGDQALAHRSGHAKDYALAFGSLAMTGVAVLVPGIPTVPFLLASGYYLARTSPRLNEAIRNAPFFGPILREMEQHHALSRRSKRKLVGFTFVVIVVTLLTTSPSPVLLLLVLLAVTASVTGINRIPEIREEAPTRLAALPSA